jgi:HSP20 family protein
MIRKQMVYSLKFHVHKFQKSKKTIVMTLVKLNNRQYPKTFNNLFDEFFNELPTTWTKGYNTELPAVNIYESNDAYELELAVPGRNKEDFNVVIEKGILTISSEVKEEKKDESLKSIRKEFGNTNFKRSFTIEDKVDAENIQAKYENGVLKFHLPKKQQAKESSKQISIQ